MTENPDIRFCDECQLNVHYVGQRSDFEKYPADTECFAVKIYNEEKTKGVTIAGGAIPDYESRASFVLKFGPKADLTNDQLKTIQWLRNLGAQPVMKSKMVRLLLRQVTEDHFDRIISILEKEEIPFSVE